MVDSPVKRKDDGVHGTFFPTARIRFALPKPRKIGEEKICEESARKIGDGAMNFSRTGLPNSVEARHQDATVTQINLTGIGPGLARIVGGGIGG